MYTVIVSSLQGPKPVRLYKAADKQPTGNCLATTPTLCTVFTVSLAYVVVLFLTRCLRARVVFYMTQSSRFRLYFCCVPQFGKTQPSLWYADAIDPPPSCFFFFFFFCDDEEPTAVITRDRTQEHFDRHRARACSVIELGLLGWWEQGGGHRCLMFWGRNWEFVLRSILLVPCCTIHSNSVSWPWRRTFCQKTPCSSIMLVYTMERPSAQVSASA